MRYPVLVSSILVVTAVTLRAAPGVAAPGSGPEPPPLSADPTAGATAPAPPSLAVDPVGPAGPPPLAAEPPRSPVPAAPAATTAPPLDPEGVLPPRFASPSSLADEATAPQPPPPPFRLGLPSALGPVGLARTSAADVGSQGQLRLGVLSEFFSASSFLVDGDENTRLGGSFVAAYTPLDFLELWAGVVGSSNRNRRVCEGGVCTSEPGRRDPEVIKALGDLVFGTKVAGALAQGFAVGAETGLRLASSISGLAIEPSATSLWFSALASWNLEPAFALPLRTHLNVGYYVDNSGQLVDYGGVDRPSRLVSSFAYGVGKSRFRSALGAEARLAMLDESVALIPFAEYHVDWVTADPDAAFADFRPPQCGAPGARPCVDNRDQQWLTLGARLAMRSGATFLLGLDIATASVGFPYGPPLAPYQLLAGFALPIDVAGPAPAVAVVRPGSVAPIEGTTADREPEARLAGVVTGPGGAPVAGAIIGIVGRPRARVATDADGGFRTGPLPVGQVELEVLAPGFEPARPRVAVNAGEESPLAITLEPQVAKAKLRGRLVDRDGSGRAGTVRLSGPELAEARIDASGSFVLDLVPGAYTLRAESSEAFPRERLVELRPGETAELELQLRPRPVVPSVRIEADRVVVLRPMSWGQPPATGRPFALSVEARAVLSELAAVLVERGDARKLVVEAHWDGGTPRDRAKEITVAQADAIVAHLASEGVPSTRLEARGAGAERPLVPNIGPANRAKNRRVELTLAR